MSAKWTLSLLAVFWTAVLVVTVVGCAALRMGATSREYQGRLLRVSNGGPGAPRLAIESAYDRTIRHILKENGDPDFIYVANNWAVQLIYLADDRLVLIQRGWSSIGQATV